MGSDTTDGAAWRVPPAFWALLALWGFAVAQPLYDLLRASPEFFIEHGADRFGLALFVAVLSALVPAALTAVVLAAGRLNNRFGDWLLLAVLAVLGVALGAQIAGRLIGRPGLTLAAALVLGAGVATAYRRWTAIHVALSWAGVAALCVFPVFFLSAPAIRGLWVPATPIETLQGGTAAPIVVVVLDELPLASLLDRDDRIERARFPSIAKLAATSSWYRNATSLTTSTGSSVTSLLTGARPKPHAAPVTAEYPRNLFTALAGSYEMRVVERVTKLCPPESCPPLIARPEASTLVRDLAVVYLHLVTPPAWRSRLAPVDQGWAAFGAATAGSEIDPRLEPPVMLQHFYAGIEPKSSPTLYYLHLLLPHVPWKYLPTGQQYAGPGQDKTLYPGKFGGSRAEREWELIQAYQRHLLQVEFTDRVLGELMTVLEQRGLFDDALFILTADHGVTFDLGGHRRSGLDSRNVPLLIKRPGQKEGRVIDRPVNLLDVLPTVLGVVQMDADWPMIGRFLADAPEREDREVTPQERRLSEARRRTVQRKLAWFPDFSGTGVYRIGPHAELIGSRPEIRRADVDPPPVSVELSEPWLFDAVVPTMSFVPACVAGRLITPGGEDRSRKLAVAINGRVAGVTHTVRGSRAEFSVMVEPSNFGPGANRVEVYQISEPSDLSLIRLPVIGSASYRLTSAGRKVFLSLPNGERLRVRRVNSLNFKLKRGLTGYVILGALRLPPDGEEPVALVFDGTRELGPIPRDRGRAARSGFRRLKVILPFPRVADPTTLRVVVVRGTKTARLQELELLR